MLRKRYEQLVAAWAGTEPGGHRMRLRLATALRTAWAGGYSWSSLRDDLLAGAVVSMVALPPSMALAIATGLRPETGLYTAIAAGMVAALLGGSKYQVTGPTAGFVVILAPIMAVHGAAGVAVATAMAGLILIAMGWFKVGRFVEYIPYPVTTGLTAGIAALLLTLSIKDFFGLGAIRLPEQYWEKLWILEEALRHKFADGPWTPGLLSDSLIGVITLAILLLWQRWRGPIRIPAPLVALPTAAVLALICTRLIPGFEVQTLRSVFGTSEAPAGIPSAAPRPDWPWAWPGPMVDGVSRAMVGSMQTARELLAAAFALAMLAAMESLLSAVVADGMTGERHDPDAELIGQGAGNVAAACFGGLAASGALARTTTNIKAGARSPVAAMTHAVLLLAFVVLLSPVLGYLPMAAMAAMLIVNGKNLLEFKHVGFVLRYAPRADAGVMVACFAVTVVFDLVLGVAVGLILAAGLFVKRMAELATVKLVGQGHPIYSQPMPPGVVVYDIGGPLFFGAANRAFASLEVTGSDLRAVVLDLADVPTIDATGLVNLDALIAKLNRRRVLVVLAAVAEQPMDVMMRAGWLVGQPLLAVAGSVEAGVEVGRAWVEEAARA